MRQRHIDFDPGVYMTLGFFIVINFYKTDDLYENGIYVNYNFQKVVVITKIPTFIFTN